MFSLVRLRLTNGCPPRSMGEGNLWLRSPVKGCLQWIMYMERCGLTLWAGCWGCNAMCGKENKLKLTNTFWLFTPLPRNTHHTSVKMLWFDLNCLVVLYWIKDVFTTPLSSNKTASLPFCFYSQEANKNIIFSHVYKGWSKCKERRSFCRKNVFYSHHKSLLSIFKKRFTPTRKIDFF